MAAVMAVAALTANAQAWIGGGIGFDTNKTSFDGDKLNSNTTFEFAPELGYNLSENTAVAIKLGYAHADEATYNFGGKSVSGNANAFSIKPYFRYSFVQAGNFSAFIDLGLSYSTIHVSGVENNLNEFGVGIQPGIAYSISEKVGLVAHLGNLGYTNTSYKVPVVDKNINNDAFQCKLFNGVSFGAYYNF